jgi:hypothetical protein
MAAAAASFTDGGSRGTSFAAEGSRPLTADIELTAGS